KPVWDLWGFNSENPMIPDSTMIRSKLAFVGFDRLNYTKNSIVMPDSMQITLGAIAKGYILDQAKQYMLRRGIDRGYINCRSSMTFFGSKLTPLVYIQHPRNPDDIIASFRTNNLSVGTSGDYQQFFEYENVRYHHLIDARTGKPVQDIYSVTVVNPSAAWADGLSTALFLLNPDQALEVIRHMDNTNVVIYCSQNDSIVSLKSEGMKDFNLSEKL
ncbi:MAG TPA: FAD:protein FMN transferase, partial [Candidatus Cloacimonadota bacterium]|nr:FAD:protein FMN transferase [Candidatus Cloacimonadota bacterium]